MFPKNLFQILGGIFDGNNVKERIASLNEEILKKNFWQDNIKSKKIIKEKNFLENIFSFYNVTIKDVKNLKDLYKLALEEDDSPTLDDCVKKTFKLNRIMPNLCEPLDLITLTR